MLAMSKGKLLLLQALQEDNVKVMTINPAQVSTPMTWSRPDSEYIPDLMIQPQEVADMCVFAFKVYAGPSFVWFFWLPSIPLLNLFTLSR